MDWCAAGAWERVGIWFRGSRPEPVWSIGHCAGVSTDADFAVWSMGHLAGAEVDAVAEVLACGTGHCAGAASCLTGHAAGGWACVDAV